MSPDLRSCWRRSGFMMRIIGFDPGYAITGWGVVESGSGISTLRFLKYGTISTPSTAAFQDRLWLIQREANRLLKEYRPDYAMVEKLYFSRNRKTAAEVFQARGVLLATIAGCGCELMQMEPSKIKQMVTGRGRATKREVIKMVQRLLGIEEKITPDDAADALAGALAGIFHIRSHKILELTGKRKHS